LSVAAGSRAPSSPERAAARVHTVRGVPAGEGARRYNLEGPAGWRIRGNCCKIYLLAHKF